MYELADFRLHHLFEIGSRLREEDLAECLANGYANPIEALTNSVAESDAVETVYLHGQPVGVFGIVEGEEGGCQVWLVGTSDMLDEPLAFHRASRRARDSLLASYSTLFNRVHSGNTAHLRWLAAMGAEIYYTDDPEFNYFEIEK